MSAVLDGVASAALETLPDVRYSDVALELDQGMSYHRAEEVGSMLGRIHAASRWWVGDYLLQTEERFGHEAAQLAETLGLSPDTLRAYAWVAERVPPVVRRRTLSWSCHREVASAEPAQRDALLNRAEREGLRSKDLRALRASPGPEVLERFAVRVPATVAAAARRRAGGRPLGDVCAELLAAWPEAGR